MRPLVFKIIFLGIVGVGVSMLTSACSNNAGSKIDPEVAREFANTLYNQQLFDQSIREYENYLTNYNVNKNEMANISFIIAGIYFERLEDYENALAYYLKVKHLFPGSALADEANKQIVACLERLERSTDAQQALAENTVLDPTELPEKRPGAVIAKIGKREITQGDLDFEISQLPPYLQEQFIDIDKKLEFLKGYIATELLYDTASRKGLDKDKDVIAGAFQAKKRLMVDKLLQEEIAEKIELDESVLELYFQAHKDKYAVRDEDGNIIEEKLYYDVREQVAQDYSQEQFQENYENLILRMMKAEQAEIFENRVK
jgi:hypothetical protein